MALLADAVRIGGSVVESMNASDDLSASGFATVALSAGVPVTCTMAFRPVDGGTARLRNAQIRVVRG